MKTLIFIILVSLGLETEASCQKAYKAYKSKVIVSPITAPAMSTNFAGRGFVSTVTNMTAGATATDTGTTLAGSANGLAFSYEGQFYLEMMSSNFRHYRGRSLVLKILNQAELGMGEELENLFEDINESLEVKDAEIDFISLVEEINQANEKKVFCPKNKELFTLKNLHNYIVNKF